jgi:hypothetical protein
MRKAVQISANARRLWRAFSCAVEWWQFSRSFRGQPKPSAKREDMKLVVGSLVVQAAAGAIALCLPFGFDHPSSLGLDFGHFLLLLAAYVVALLVGVVAAFMRRKFFLAFLQMAVPCGIAILGFAGVLNM